MFKRPITKAQAIHDTLSERFHVEQHPVDMKGIAHHQIDVTLDNHPDPHTSVSIAFDMRHERLLIMNDMDEGEVVNLNQVDIAGQPVLVRVERMLEGTYTHV